MNRQGVAVMRWRPFYVSSVFSILLAGTGCGGHREPLVDRSTPPFEAPSVARGQKAGPVAAPKPPPSLLDSLPEHESDGTGGQVAARIRATVNGVPIFDEEVRSMGYQFFMAVSRLAEPERSQKYREVFQEMLDQLIERELILQDAFAKLEKAPRTLDKLKEAAGQEFDKRWIATMKKANKIKGDEEFKDFLRRQGLSLDAIRRQWTRQFMATEYMRSMILPKADRVGHEQLREYYDSHPQEFKVDDGVHWLDLYVSAGKHASAEAAREFAEQLANRARREDFTALCDKHDDGDSKLRKGEGIGKKRGEIQPPELEPILFRMREGDVGPVVPIGSGFHVFKLVKRDYAGVKPFGEEVQKEIRTKLRNEMANREMKKFVDNLRKRAVIEFARAPR